MREYEGVQYIGDPHASSRRPGRRKDDFAASVLAKLAECAEKSHELKLKTVILGDLFHSAGENDLTLLNRLARVLRSFYSPVHIVVGNHDKGRFNLSDGDALTFIFESGAAIPLGVDMVDVQGVSVRIVGVGHGDPLPNSVEREGADVVNLVTHHDLAFGSAYPGALPLTEIPGVDFVVNGHMHDTKPSVIKGSTVWHNPGNIEPLSIDLRDHVPAFWVWTPSSEGHKLSQHVLKHDSDCFDLTGLVVEATDAVEAVEALPAPSTPGEFATQLAAEDVLAAEKTDDANVLAEDLQVVLSSAGVSEATALLMSKLMERVQLKAASA